MDEDVCFKVIAAGGFSSTVRGMNSCRTGYYSASYLRLFDFSSIRKLLRLLWQLFMPACWVLAF